MTKDPFRYFRIEAREILTGLTEGIVELDKGSRDPAVVAKLLRLTHTLKGAARVVKLRGVAELAHALEDRISPFREPGVSPSEPTTELLALVDAIATHVAALDAAPGPPLDAAHGTGARPAEPAAPVTPATDERFETVRVELSDMDRLLDDVAEVGAKLASVRRSAAAVGDARIQRDLLAGVDAVARELEQVQDTTGRLRLLPVSTVLGLVERVARDSARALGKRLEFTAAGGEVRLDAHVLAGLRAALVQLVRNAVAHGIEPEEERRAAGKPGAGSVRVSVSRRIGHRVVLAVADDGRGIDVEAVRRVALRRGLLTAADAADPSFERMMQLLFRGGVSTARTVTEMAGRGVGLDIVRDAVARLNGEAVARSVAGGGTTIELTVPVSLASLAALGVEASGLRLRVPLDGVAGTLRVLDRDVARAGDGRTIVHGGVSIPMVLFEELHTGRDTATHRAAVTAVVVRASNGQAAIGVDRLLGTGQVVVRPLPAAVAAAPFVAGATLDVDGNPELVLDAFELVEAARAPRPRGPERPIERRHPVLVVDDSLTTRMLERSILESAGYDVDLATSGEEALEKGRGQRYSLFVVDVEMPGMDGFELATRVRSDPVLRDVPVILVTSRGAPEDRRRGLEVGARAYIVKSEFDEGRLLTIVRSLVR